jgi:phage head maturation protease
MTTTFELRNVAGATVAFTGYASTTETPYEVADYVEVIKRNAFKRTLNENPDTVLLVNHEGLPLARTSAGTMSLLEDDQGLRVDAQLDARTRQCSRFSASSPGATLTARCRSPLELLINVGATITSAAQSNR